MITIENYINKPLKDNRINANSRMVTMKIGDYLSMISLKENPYQRSLEKLSFYNKLITDLLNDGVMPPISVVYNGHINSNFELDKSIKFKIIDGLQRTNCLIACKEKLLKLLNTDNYKIQSLDDFFNKEIYIEIWEDIDLKSILYKMVVLNTGQRKMDYSHQLDILSESVEIELKKHDIDYLTVIESQNTRSSSNKHGVYLLSEITTGLISYINRSPISSKKNAAEFLFNKLDIDINNEKEILLIDDEDTYSMMIWILKDFTEVLDKMYGKDKNPLRIYDVFLTSVFAAIGFAKEKCKKNYALNQTLNEKLKLLMSISSDKDILCIDDYLNYIKYFKSGIGDKRRKFIFEAFYSFLITPIDRSDKLEWSNIYEQYFQ